MSYGKRNKAPTLRVEWWNADCGVVVKFYNAKTLADVKLMKGFEARKVEQLAQSNYAAECRSVRASGGYQWTGGAA